MKALGLSICAILVFSLGYAQSGNWIFEPSHCKIGFSVTHFGISETEGQFRKYEGTLALKGPTFENAEIAFTVDVNSIDTDNKDRDAHLKSVDFFDAEKHPTLQFKSRSFKQVGKNMFKLVGDLTMRGATKPVELDVTYGGIIEKDPFGNTKAGFKVVGSLNRKDWGLAWNRVLETGGLAVGENVKLVCNIELQKVK